MEESDVIVQVEKDVVRKGINGIKSSRMLYWVELYLNKACRKYP